MSITEHGNNSWSLEDLMFFGAELVGSGFSGPFDVIVTLGSKFFELFHDQHKWKEKVADIYGKYDWEKNKPWIYRDDATYAMIGMTKSDQISQYTPLKKTGVAELDKIFDILFKQSLSSVNNTVQGSREKGKPYKRFDPTFQNVVENLDYEDYGYQYTSDPMYSPWSSTYNPGWSFNEVRGDGKKMNLNFEGVLNGLDKETMQELLNSVKSYGMKMATNLAKKGKLKDDPSIFLETHLEDIFKSVKELMRFNLSSYMYHEGLQPQKMDDQGYFYSQSGIIGETKWNAAIDGMSGLSQLDGTPMYNNASFNNYVVAPSIGINLGLRQRYKNMNILLTNMLGQLGSGNEELKQYNRMTKGENVSDFDSVFNQLGTDVSDTLSYTEDLDAAFDMSVLPFFAIDSFSPMMSSIDEEQREYLQYVEDNREYFMENEFYIDDVQDAYSNATGKSTPLNDLNDKDEETGTDPIFEKNPVDGEGDFTRPGYENPIEDGTGYHPGDDIPTVGPEPPVREEPTRNPPPPIDTIPVQNPTNAHGPLKPPPDKRPWEEEEIINVNQPPPTLPPPPINQRPPDRFMDKFQKMDVDTNYNDMWNDYLYRSRNMDGTSETNLGKNFNNLYFHGEMSEEQEKKIQDGYWFNERASGTDFDSDMTLDIQNIF